jgi:putative transposase
MPGPAPAPVTLSQAERDGLEQLLRRPSTPQQIALRARIVLACDDGLNNSDIAGLLGVSRQMVIHWRSRWIGLSAASLGDLPLQDRLSDAERSGRPCEITAEARCQIQALACEAPSQSGRPISQWTSREIADEIVRRGILARISRRHAARLLKKPI